MLSIHNIAVYVPVGSIVIGLDPAPVIVVTERDAIYIIFAVGGRLSEDGYCICIEMTSRWGGKY